MNSHCSATLRLAGSAARKQAALVGEINQDRARLEYDLACIGIDDDRNLVVGAERDEFGHVLLAFTQVDGSHCVRQIGLVQHDRGLLTVWRCGGVERNHGGPFSE